MDEVNNKSVRFPKVTDEKLEKISLKLGRPKKMVIIQMVDYFYGTKKDPVDFNDELLKKELTNGVSRILSFVKRQEADFLLPILTDTTGLTDVVKEHTAYFKAIGKYVSQNHENIKEVKSHLELMDDSIARTQKYLDEKLVLKMRFKKILDYYISQRESLGWPVSAAKKEELQAHTRQSLENL